IQEQEPVERVDVIEIAANLAHAPQCLADGHVDLIDESAIERVTVTEVSILVSENSLQLSDGQKPHGGQAEGQHPAFDAKDTEGPPSFLVYAYLRARREVHFVYRVGIHSPGHVANNLVQTRTFLGGFRQAKASRGRSGEQALEDGPRSSQT